MPEYDPFDVSEASRFWRLWIDVGGTFTDCLAVDPDGCFQRAKVLSNGALRGRIRSVAGREDRVRWSSATPPMPRDFFAGCQLIGPGGAMKVLESSPEGVLRLHAPWRWGEADGEIRSHEGAPALAARLVTETAHGTSLPAAEVRFATTRGTNALLERRGTPPALFITRGFGDLLKIGDQRRPELFALRVETVKPLSGAVVEVDERLRADGTVDRALAMESFESQARELLKSGYRSAAVAFLHSYRNQDHERQVAVRLRELGFSHVSCSSDLSARLQFVSRTETAVIDAYLSEVVGEYLRALELGLGARSLHVMTSAGGLKRVESYRSKDSLLSGPAGGVVGAAAVGIASGADRLLAFDMGGTSTDVTRYDGRFEYRSETIVGGAHLTSPCLAVETVAAGGGSVCRFDGSQLKVGPESAGADPGPACYGRGGPLTLTDVNLLLGRLEADRFPFSVDRDAAERMVQALASEHFNTLGIRASPDELLLGFLQIANETMAAAVRAISLRAGFNPREYALVTFGGAGPQHACGVAELLEVEHVLVPKDAALLSALGLGDAEIQRIVERQVLEPLAVVDRKLEQWFNELRAEAVRRLAKDGVRSESVEVEHREVFLRFVGQDATVRVEWSGEADVGESFCVAYEEQFGYRPEGRQPEVESLRLVAGGGRGGVFGGRWRAPSGAAQRPPNTRRSRLFAAGAWRESVVIERQSMALDDDIDGPALIVEGHTVTVVEPGWKARMDHVGAVVMEAG